MGWIGYCAVKYFKKKHGRSRAEGTFSENGESSNTNTQYSYLLSKCQRNLFHELLERPECQVFFFPLPNIVETTMEALALIVIYLFNQDVLDFVLKMCL